MEPKAIQPAQVGQLMLLECLSKGPFFVPPLLSPVIKTETSHTKVCFLASPPHPQVRPVRLQGTLFLSNNLFFSYLLANLFFSWTRTPLFPFTMFHWKTYLISLCFFFHPQFPLLAMLLFLLRSSSFFLSLFLQRVSVQGSIMNQ